jgi:hypothetical protein
MGASLLVVANGLRLLQAGETTGAASPDLERLAH